MSSRQILQTVNNIELRHSPPKMPEETTADASDHENNSDNSIQTFEDILEMIGSWGPWNIRVFFFTSFCTLMNPLHLVSYEFLGATPNYWCHVDTLHAANWTDEQILDLAIPHTTEGGENEGCLMYDYDYNKAVDLGFEAAMSNTSQLWNGDLNSVIPCYERDFNLSEYKSTVTTEWDLVCERRALLSTTQSVTQTGKLFGFLIFGIFINKFGRRRATIAAVFLCFVMGMATCFVDSYIAYIIFKGLVALNTSGYYTGCFVTLMELCTPSQRSMVGAVYLLPWAIGYMVTPGIAYLVREWRWLQAAYTLPVAMLSIYIWVLPESPRWLIQNGRFEEAMEIIVHAAKVNKRSLPSTEYLLDGMKNIKVQEQSPEGSQTTHNRIIHGLKDIFALMMNARLRVRTLVIFTCWLMVSMIYYGLSLNASNLSADPYIYIFLGGVVEVPSYLFLWPAIAYMGRRATLIGLYATCGVSIGVVAIIISLELDVSVNVKMAFSLVGKMSVTAAFHLLFVYTAELYPTKIRSLAVSQSSTVSRVGSLSSPYIIDILGEVREWAPSVVFAGSAFGVALLVFTLPETKDTYLTEEEDFKPYKKIKNVMEMTSPT